MKIVVLADFPVFLIPGSGIEHRPAHYATWLPQLAEGFSGHLDEFEFHWITLSDALSEPRQVMHLGQHVHLLPKAARGRAASLYRQDMKAIRDLIGDIQPDLVHGWGTEDVYGWAAVRLHPNHIVSMQGILTYYIRRNRYPLRFYLQAALEAWVLARARLVTVESRWGRRQLVPFRFEKPVECVEYGVNSRWFEATWNPDPERPAAIFVGGVNPRKGVQDLVGAFSSPELKHAECWIVGDGDPGFTESLKAKSSSNIKWLGRKPMEETIALMEKAWCLVLPTRADTSPNVIKEARVLGLPVITTRDGGQSDYIHDGENGFLVRPGDIPGLVSAIKETTSSLNTARKRGAEHHINQKNHFHPERTGKLFLNLYQKQQASLR